MEAQSNRRCKYCGEKLYGEWVKGFGNCFWCANDNCTVKPCTDYGNASSSIWQADLNGITMDKMGHSEL